MTVSAVVEGLTHRYTALGRVRFWLAGHEHALTAYPGYHGAVPTLESGGFGLVAAIDVHARLPQLPLHGLRG